jgi:hypothetical protein
MIPHLTRSLLEAVSPALQDLRHCIENVQPRGFDEAHIHELIAFDIVPGQKHKPEISGRYIGALRGRNRSLCLGFGQEQDKAIALRVYLDGDAQKVEPLSEESL